MALTLFPPLICTLVLRHFFLFFSLIHLRIYNVKLLTTTSLAIKEELLRMLDSGKDYKIRKLANETMTLQRMKTKVTKNETNPELSVCTVTVSLSA
mmetsp:Transcript_24597/g.27993  ORF Transcript_24597/g.27993 Transcript_24597/m.27993 type:complete len:96 (-) Transcript_24597:229-516(-)